MQRFVNARDIRGHLFSFLVNDDGRIGECCHDLNGSGAKVSRPSSCAEIDLQGRWVVPGAVDMHVHSRDPGYPDKETWQSLSAAALKGGVVAVADMPNTKPPTLDRRSLEIKMERARGVDIEARFFVGVLESSLRDLAHVVTDRSLPVCGVKVYYGESTGGLTFAALDDLDRALGSRDVLCVFHAEDGCLMEANRQRLGANATNSVRSHSDIRSSDAALAATRAIADWVQKTHRRSHLAHVSTAQELQVVGGTPSVTAEVAPHHLLLDVGDYETYGSFVQVNPPLRSPQEREELGRSFAAGAFRAFATDHAPHTREEKQRPYPASPSGIPAIEFYYPLLFLAADRCGLSRVAAVAMASEGPAQLAGFEGLGRLEGGYWASFVVLEEGMWTAQPSDVRSRCGWSPYVGWKFPVRVLETWHRGRRAYG